ncbi:MAG: caspase family protein, partial [Kiritimatiellae bacterium]|nr:caspase family protein [Kiritimatiellia bacterium]
MKTIAIAAAALAAIFALPSQAASFNMLSCCPGEDYDTKTEYETLAYKKVALSEDEATPVAATAEGRYYALTVGVDLYSNPNNNLNCCNPDVKNVLSACTNSVNGLWRPGDCYRICDSNATLSAVRAQFQSLAATAQSGDTVLYYQSSHGGNNVLCLHDKNYSESNFASDLMRFNSGVRVIVMLDACHSASMFKGVDTASKEEGSWNFAANVEARIAELQDELRAKGAKAINSPSIGWVTACDYNQLSWGGSTGSTFTKKMVSAWKSAKTTDANGDRYNDFLEIFNIGGPQATGDHGEDGWTIPQKLNDDMLASVAAWDIAGTPRVHGRWIGGNGDNRFSLATNWDDWTVPSAGDALDFSYVTSATTINADVAATFGAVTMGAGIVTFTGDLSATSFSDASKIAVGANSIVTLDGDLVCTSAVGEWSLGGLDGVFAVTGDATVESGASLALAGAGTATIGGALSLEAGSRLVAGAALRTGSLLLPGSGAAEISFSDEFGVNVATTILSITGDGALAEGDLAKLSPPDGYILSLGSGGKSLAVTRY